MPVAENITRFPRPARQHKPRPGKTLRSQRENHMFNLESDLCNAANMASLAAELVENKLTGSGEITLHPEESELILFAVYEAHQRIEALRDQYLDALKLER